MDFQELGYSSDEEMICKMIDEKLASIDLDTLLAIKSKLESNREDTELIDKAIAHKKASLEKERKDNKLTLGQILFGVSLGMEPNKKRKTDYEDELKQAGYESWNFEEEELEEDDYYHDDLD